MVRGGICFAAFPPREWVSRLAVPKVSWRGHSLLKLLDLVQPVLVFVPIAVTWYGLKEATSAYGETLAAGGIEAARRPFLEMWQQGFDGKLPAWLQFDGVAFMTLSAIVLLVAVTLGERLLRRSIEQQAEEQVDALRARLLAALTRATLVLAQVRLSSPVRFQAELTKSAAEMHKLGETTMTVYTKVVEALDLALAAAARPRTRWRRDSPTCGGRSSPLTSRWPRSPPPPRPCSARSSGPRTPSTRSGKDR